MASRGRCSSFSEAGWWDNTLNCLCLLCSESAWKKLCDIWAWNWDWFGLFSTFATTFLGHPCTVYTDHAACLAILNTPKPLGKLARWALTIQEMDLTIRHKSGKKNTTLSFRIKRFLHVYARYFHHNSEHAQGVTPKLSNSVASPERTEMQEITPTNRAYLVTNTRFWPLLQIQPEFAPCVRKKERAAIH